MPIQTSPLMIPGQQKRLSTKLAAVQAAAKSPEITHAHAVEAAEAAEAVRKQRLVQSKVIQARLARRRAQQVSKATSRQQALQALQAHAGASRLMHQDWFSQNMPSMGFMWLLLGGFVVLLTCLSIACIHNVNALSNKLDVIVAALSRA